MRLQTQVIVIWLALLATPSAPRPPSGPATTGPQGGDWLLSAGSLVYESHARDRVNIHRFDAGSDGPVALTNHRARDLRPRWSPDGSRVAFHSDLRGNNDVYIVNADGTRLTRVTDHPGEDFDPDWMPDGRLLFASDRDGDQNIWIKDLETGSVLQLTRYPGGRTGGPSPSGDGRRIAFSTTQVLSWQVYTLDLASGAIERITGPLPGRCNPAWNPAADQIAYMAGGDVIGTDLRVRTADGGAATSIVSNDGDNQDPQFSQDGSRLVWVTDRHGSFDIYEAAADGSGESRVSRTREDERHPDLFLRRRR